ncbi:hypothetical protein D3C72_1041100 [compost metagenome]
MVLGGQGAVLVHVDLGDLGAAVVGVGQLVQGGGDHLAGATPFGPEIDQHRFLGIQYGAIKVGIADVYNLVAHLGFSSWIAPGQAGGG